MEFTKVTPENLRAQAAKVDQEATNYYSEYRGLLTDVETLTSIGYKGEDASLFRDKVNGFEKDFNKMKTLMNEYAEFLRRAAENYDNRQQQSIREIQGLR